MKKFVKKVLKIAGIGIGGAVIGLVGIYAWVGVGVTMDARARYPEHYEKLVYDVATNGYTKLWEEVGK